MNIKTVLAKNATDFVDHIRLSHPLWQMNKYIANRDWQSREVWGFRGQRDTNWGLTPSAFRKTTILGYKKDSTYPPLTADRQKQIEKERKAVVDFLFFTDRVGLPVPGDGQHIRLPRNVKGQQEHIWPLEFTETLALAQHHGVPTRLLDFSHDPMVAAYFACYDAWEQMGKPSVNEVLTDSRKLAIWAVHLPLIFDTVAKADSEGSYSRIIMISVPRAVNTFLHQQDGFFLVDLFADEQDYPPLEKAILDLQAEALDTGEVQFSDDMIIKIELEWRFVPAVLGLMWNEFFHRAKLQPTYDKSVEALEDYRELYR